jgi:hypothetical protein
MMIRRPTTSSRLAWRGEEKAGKPIPVVARKLTFIIGVRAGELSADSINK